MNTVIRALAAVIAVATISFATISFPTSGQAQEVCIPREDAIRTLAVQHDESVASRGLIQDGRAMIEVFVSKAGTWTVVTTDTQGVSCIVANGDSWFAVTAPKGDPA